MLPKNPEDWPSVFEKNLNTGDLDAVMTLYERDARFVARSGEILVGRDRIRELVAGLIQAKTKMKSRVVKAITLDNVLCYIPISGHDGRCDGNDDRAPLQCDRGPPAQSDGT
jgi:hypothetical protein